MNISQQFAIVSETILEQGGISIKLVKAGIKAIFLLNYFRRGIVVPIIRNKQEGHLATRRSNGQDKVHSEKVRKFDFKIKVKHGILLHL